MKNRFLFLVGIGALLAMSSCSKDEENLVVKSGEPATLKLTINGSDLSTKATTATDLTVPNESFDNKINNIVVGVFRDDGNELDGMADAIVNVTVSEVLPATTPRSFSIPAGNEIKVTAGIRDVIVVANASDADFEQLRTATTKELFLKKVLVLADKYQDKDKLLMTGVKEDFDVVKLVTNSISLEVTRLVGRVQLTSLKCSFKNSYANAELDVDQIFLHNALFNCAVDGSELAVLDKKFYTGYNPLTPYPETYDPNLINEISTPYPLAGENDVTEFLPVDHYFYTFPNNLTTPTKLVISGKFYPNGLLGTFYRVYYPIVVNNELVAGNIHKGIGIERNYVYSISAKILRSGVLDPDEPLDPASISLTITVTNWNNITQDNEL